MSDHSADDHECPACTLADKLLDVIEASDVNPITVLRAFHNIIGDILAVFQVMEHDAEQQEETVQ